MQSTSRSPRGERGLKLSAYLKSKHFRERRSPRGERGLKCGAGEYSIALPQVAPLAGSVD